MSTEPRARELAPAGVQFVKDLLPEYEAGPSWIGIGGPANLPRPIVMRLNAAINKAIREPKVQENFAPQRTIVAGSTPEDFGNKIKSEIARMGKVIRDANIRDE